MIELQNVLVAIIQPSQASRLVKQLAITSPLAGLQHLKRVRKLHDSKTELEIIICPIVQPSSTTQPEHSSQCIWEEALLRTLGVTDELLRIIAEHELRMRSLAVRSLHLHS